MARFYLRTGYEAPRGTVSGHGDAHPTFRSPLSSGDEIEASAEFHGAVIRRLAAGQHITIVTFDFENEWQGHRTHQTSSLDGTFDRELLWSITALSEEEDEEDEEESTDHVFITQVEADDPRLDEVWAMVSDSCEPLLVVGPDASWIARPHEECLVVESFDAADIETLREVERETWARWGIPQDRSAILDLSRVASYFESRREAWRHSGVRVVTEPQYRTWLNPFELDKIVESLPDDLSLTDWFLVELESDRARVMLVVHDSGAYTRQLYPDIDDEDEEMIYDRPGSAGSVDFEGVVDIFERSLAILAGGSSNPETA